jgi:ATP-dependent Clp protease ATP-binding subunit ClpB
LDDGRLTDNTGRVVNFKNTIIIMTSNIASDVILENFSELQMLDTDEERQMLIADTKKEIFGMLTDFMSPEFLNRIDEKVMFLPLDKEQIKKVALLQIKDLKNMLDNQGIQLDIKDEALNLLAENGYDPVYGARPLKRLIQQEVTDEIAKLILGDKLVSGNTIEVNVENGKFVFGVK